MINHINHVSFNDNNLLFFRISNENLLISGVTSAFPGMKNNISWINIAFSIKQTSCKIKRCGFSGSTHKDSKLIRIRTAKKEEQK